MSPPVVRVAVVSVTAWRVTRAVCGCHVSRAVLGSLTITFPAIAWASLQLVSWEMVPSLPRSWPGPTLKRISCGPITNKNFYLHCSINRVFSAWKGGEDIKHADIVYTEVRSSQLWTTFYISMSWCHQWTICEEKHLSIRSHRIVLYNLYKSL